MESNTHTPLVYLPKSPKHISANDFAIAIGVTKGTVCYWIRKGRLPGCIQHHNGYYSVPTHYIEEVQRGELPLAPANQRRKLA